MIDELQYLSVQGGVSLYESGDGLLEFSLFSVNAEGLPEGSDLAKSLGSVILSCICSGLSSGGSLLVSIDKAAKFSNFCIVACLKSSKSVLYDGHTALKSTDCLESISKSGLGSEGCLNPLLSLLKFCLGSEGWENIRLKIRLPSLKSRDPAAQSVSQGLESRDLRVDRSNILIVLRLKSRDLVFKTLFQSSVCSLVSSFKVSDVLVVLSFECRKRVLQGGNVVLRSREGSLEAADSGLESGYLALQRSYRTLEGGNTVVRVLDILRVVRTAGVRECYASDSEHRNQSKKFFHKG